MTAHPSTLKAVSLAAVPTLPPQPTALIGREDVLAHAAALVLGGTRLLTLLGPGGVGKTRMAVALAERLAPDFQNSAAFVDLTGELHVAALPGRIAHAFGLTLSSQSELDSLVAQLQDHPRLLLLDNFESVPAAAPLLGELIAACPALSVLVTSRAALNLRWERRLALEPLALPTGAAPEQVAASPAVQLYLERARAVGGPELTDLTAVARLCARLDGLPLAIELAAARAVQFGPDALMSRLNRRLALPQSPAPDRPARHHSLDAAIGTSYELLSGAHRAVLRRLAVAAGGTGEDAAQAVAATDELGVDALDALLALADLSLLHTRSGQDGEPRFLMLETIRAYALGQADPAETLLARQRHAHWCLELAERLTPRWRLPEQAQVLARLDDEQATFRAALNWTLGTGLVSTESMSTKSMSTESMSTGASPADRLLGERLAETLWPFWLARGHAAEGRAWMKAALGSVRGQSSAGLLRGVGVLARQGGDVRQAACWAEQAVLAARLAADTRQEAAAMGDLGVALALEGDLGRAGDAFEAQLNLYTVLGDDQGATDALNNRGTVTVRGGDWAQATGLLGRVLTLRQQLGDVRGEAETRNNMGVLACQTEDWAQATAQLIRALDLRRELGDRSGEAETLGNLGLARRLAGTLAGAVEAFREALALRRELAEPLGIAAAQLNLGTALLDLNESAEATELLLAAAQEASAQPTALKAGAVQALAALVAQRQQWTLAARLLGAADVLWETVPAPWPAQQKERDDLCSVVRAHLGEIELRAALAAGRVMSWDEVLADAAERVSAGVVASGAASVPAAHAPTDRDALSEREREVLALLVNGWPNKKIAAAMKLSDNTVKNHLASVYSKLGVRGRAEAVARALQEKLLE